MRQWYVPLLLLACIILFPRLLKAQTVPGFCGARANTDWQSPAFQDALRSPETARTTGTPYYIPVVVHLIYQDTTHNAPDTFVTNLIEELNLKFANKGKCNRPGGTDIGVQFCLAVKDTAGNPTTGITRNYDSASAMYMYIMSRGLSTSYRMDSLICTRYHWDTKRYFNIYIVDGIYLYGSAYGGYGYYPGNHGNTIDGVFLQYMILDPKDKFYRYDIIAHEAGHYLGLYHTFEFGCSNTDCTTMNDQVCDTPPDNYASVSDTLCNSNSCSTDTDDFHTRNPFRDVSLGGLGDQHDDARNFMDYSDCIERFTPGQRDRMVAALTTTRASLLSSGTAVCNIPPAGISDPTGTATFTLSPNPFGNSVSVKTHYAGSFTVDLFNALGNKVYSTTLSGQQHDILLPELPQGIYLYIVKGATGVLSSGKLLKQ